MATVTVTGGTGAYKAVKGTGTNSCSTTDAGVTYTCTALFKLTGFDLDRAAVR